MTPGRLKQIEDNLGAAFWIGGPTAVFARDALELVTALRDTEAEVERLREVVRQVHTLADEEQHGLGLMGAYVRMLEIHKLTEEVAK